MLRTYLTNRGIKTMQQAHLHLIKWAINKGYTLEVWGDGVDIDYTGSKYKPAKEAAEACDTAHIMLYKDANREAGKPYEAWFAVNNWNDGDERIGDYSANAVGEAWDADYEATR